MMLLVLEKINNLVKTIFIIYLWEILKLYTIFYKKSKKSKNQYFNKLAFYLLSESSIVIASKIS